ncbi:hypothetical protein TNCV_2971451 [Trichonephila clavipes]|nr:hypothetical protein TNCV_2971451 [Trichonephila clavipes]
MLQTNLNIYWKNDSDSISPSLGKYSGRVTAPPPCHTFCHPTLTESVKFDFMFLVKKSLFKSRFCESLKIRLARTLREAATTNGMRHDANGECCRSQNAFFNRLSLHAYIRLSARHISVGNKILGKGQME